MNDGQRWCTRVALRNPHIACTIKGTQTIQLRDLLEDLLADICVVKAHVHKVLHGQCEKSFAVDAALFKQRHVCLEIMGYQVRPHVRHRAVIGDVYNTWIAGIMQWP